MPVLQLFNAPRSEEDLIRLAWFNIDHHRNVTNWLQANKNLTVEQFVLYPLPPQEGMAAWLLNHQSWHTQINSALKTRSNDLLSVDFSDYDALAAWAFLHATEHQTWQSMTGVA